MELWTYCKVAIRGTGGVFLLQLTGQSEERLFGLEVDDHGKSLRRDDGTLRFHVFERKEIAEMRPLTLLAGRLVEAAKARGEVTKTEQGAGSEKPGRPPV